MHLQLKPSLVALVALLAFSLLPVAAQRADAPDSKNNNLPALTPSKGNDKPLQTGPLFGVRYGEALVPETVALPGGAFEMGQPNANLGCYNCAQDEQPVHRIEITPFELGRFEVTNAQYEAFALSTGREHAEWRQYYTKGHENYPVYNVSWGDAQAYCAWLQAVTGRAYRLPTEAEWEFAARASFRGLYGDTDILERTRARHDNGSGPVQVGKYKPNRFGLYDLLGNVWEWCSDWYSEDYYKSSSAHDPQGPSEGQYRVMRGGSWQSTPDQCRVANRFWYNPGFTVDGRGLRVAVSIANK